MLDLLCHSNSIWVWLQCPTLLILSVIWFSSIVLLMFHLNCGIRSLYDYGSKGDGCWFLLHRNPLFWTSNNLLRIYWVCWEGMLTRHEIDVVTHCLKCHPQHYLAFRFGSIMTQGYVHIKKKGTYENMTWRIGIIGRFYVFSFYRFFGGSKFSLQRKLEVLQPDFDTSPCLLTSYLYLLMTHDSILSF